MDINNLGELITTKKNIIGIKILWNMFPNIKTLAIKTAILQDDIEYFVALHNCTDDGIHLVEIAKSIFIQCMPSTNIFKFCLSTVATLIVNGFDNVFPLHNVLYSLSSPFVQHKTALLKNTL